MTEQAPSQAEGSRPPLNRTKVGVVVRDKMSKTRTVAVDYSIQHPKYGKYLRRTTRLHVHDEHDRSREGDTVEVVYGRPYSKTKAWRLLRVLSSPPGKGATGKAGTGKAAPAAAGDAEGATAG